MKASVDVKIGLAVYHFEFDEKDEMDTLNKVATLGNPPRFCNVCQNNQFFVLDSNKDKEGNTYVNLKCTNPTCFAKAKLGQYKTGGYFWHKFEKYEPKKEAINE